MSDSDIFEDLIGLKITVDDMKHHAKLARMKEGKGCFVCDYNGYTTNYQGKAVMCTCTKEKFFLELFQRADVPSLFCKKTTDDWNTRTDSLGNDLGPQQKISEMVYSLLKFYDKNLYKICNGVNIKITHTGNIRNNLHSMMFEGSYGSGKTFIASVLVQSAIRQGLTAKYYDWADMIQTLSDFDKKAEADTLLEEFKHLDFIAIDGVEIYQYMPPQIVPQLDRVSKARLNSGKPSIIMTFGNILNYNGGSGWNSLIKNCLHIRLPQTVR